MVHVSFWDAQALIDSKKNCNSRLQEGLFYHYFYEAAGRSCFRINFVSEKSDSHASITLWEVGVWRFRGDERRLLARLPRVME